MDTQSEKFKENLGGFLRAARDSKGLSLRAVEQATGVSNAYLSQLETGKIRQPSPVVLHELSNLYGVPYEDLLELSGYPVPRPSSADSGQGRLASRLGPVTREEEEALAEYLEFLRSRRRQGNQR